MSLLRLAPICLLLLFLNACGSGTHAAATRVLDADSGALSAAPICFVPPDPELSLTERAQLANIQGICEGAARKQGLPVVPYGNGQCLAATMIWTTHATGNWNDDCVRTFTGAECTSVAVHAKSVKVALTQPASGRVLAETTAVIHSEQEQFSQTSFLALCSAAFHDFPKPLSNAQFDVPLD